VKDCFASLIGDGLLNWGQYWDSKFSDLREFGKNHILGLHGGTLSLPVNETGLSSRESPSRHLSLLGDIQW
jgi:hypothetical protein